MSYSHLGSNEVTVVASDIPFEIMRGAFTQQRFAPHAHDTYAIGTMERGLARVQFKGREVLHRAGDVVTICPGEVHTGENVDPDGWAYRMLYIPSELMQRFTGVDAAPAFAASGVYDPDLAERITAAHAFLETGASWKAKSLALSTVMEVLCSRHALRESCGSGSRLLERAAVVRKYIEENYARRVSLGMLAEVAQTGKFSMSREFKRAFGMNPYEYLSLVRVMRARDLLQQGARTNDAAYLSGYADQAHMSRNFKRVLGATPARYARKYRPPKTGKRCTEAPVDKRD